MPPSPEDTIQRALSHRLLDVHAAERAGIEAYRLLNGLGDHAPAGLTLDRYADYLVLSVRDQVQKEVIDAYAQAAKTVLPESKALVLKRLPRQAAGACSERIWGELPAGMIQVQEDEARYLIELNEGRQTGLFIDHRQTRRRVRDLAADQRVLNLFAYTCAFSVQAALGGALQLTSVDVARRALRRGRDNFEASGLDPNRHRWFDDDVMRFLARPGRPEYGVVLADPPVTGRSKRGLFSLLKSLDPLVEGLVQRVTAGGTLVFSTHALELDADRLKSTLNAAAAAVGRRLGRVRFSGLSPWDHPIGPANQSDRGDYLITLEAKIL